MSFLGHPFRNDLPEPLPANIEKQITTAHDHEGPQNKPLWLVWRVDISRDGRTDGPQLKSIADTEEMARFFAAEALDELERVRTEPGERYLHIERVPANHNFGNIDFYKFREFIERRATLKRFR